MVIRINVPRPDRPGPEFEIAGEQRTVKVGDDGAEVEVWVPWVETFRCVPDIPAAVMDRLIDANGSEIRSVAVVVPFFKDMLVREDVPRFLAVIEDRDRSVTLQVLAEVLEAIQEEYTSRPQGGQPGSLPSLPANGRTSTDPLSPPAGTPGT